MRRAVTVCRKIEDTLANSFLFVGFALVNLPFPQAANHFRITGANISFTFGIATHDAKFKILKRKNQQDDSPDEMAKLNDYLQECLSIFTIYCEEDP